MTRPTPSPFQSRVQPWMMECFGPTISADKLERNDRFIEEALELVQASGYTKERAHALVDYTFGRPQGEISQEVGGVMVTLAALCLANGVDMHEAGETELQRISAPEVIAKIRAKQAAKPTGSALPVATPSPALPSEVTEKMVEAGLSAARKVGLKDAPVTLIYTAMQSVAQATTVPVQADVEHWVVHGKSAGVHSMETLCGIDFRYPIKGTDHRPELVSCKACIAAAIAAMQATPETGWQRIETAPKDGTLVLLWLEPQQRRCRGRVTTWADIFWKYVRKGCDRSDAAYRADLWEARRPALASQDKAASPFKSEGN